METLTAFLQSYLALDPRADLRPSIQAFVASEDARTVLQLKEEVRRLLAGDLTQQEIGQLLEREGNYRWQDTFLAPKDFLLRVLELLQILGPAEPERKPFDVFISYSSRDRAEAERIATELRRHGFGVWLDSDEILVGHNIVDEVYKGIRSSDLMLVLITKHSNQSRWVMEELSRGRLEEIERQEVVVLPALLEACDVPEPLRTKRYADFRSDWERGFAELLAAIRAFQAEKMHTRPDIIRASELETTRLHHFYSENQDRLRELGWPESEGFKDVVIGIPDGETASVPKESIRGVVDDCRVKFRHFGGAPFPYPPYPENAEQRYSEGVRLSDTTTWPYSDWSFSYWDFHQSVCFVHRAALEEDHILGQGAEPFAKGTLAISWALKDIAAPFMFAHRLLSRLHLRCPIVVQLNWVGLSNRKLAILNQSRVPFFRDYVSTQERFNQQRLITNSTDLHRVVYEVAKELFWLFNWDNLGEQFEKDIQSLVRGDFPD